MRVRLSLSLTLNIQRDRAPEPDDGPHADLDALIESAPGQRIGFTATPGREDLDD